MKFIQKFPRGLVHWMMRGQQPQNVIDEYTHGGNTKEYLAHLNEYQINNFFRQGCITPMQTFY
jgi:hypothetical protein